MVGLKTFWITLFALLSLASCIPQAKKSECGSNEAFNTTLRACMPVVQGPSAFIDITGVAPTIPYTKFRQVTGTEASMPFTITVSNPYLQAYFIRWTHNYNGTETILKCVAPTVANANKQVLTVPSYSTRIGTNLLTADIVDSCASSTTHDSHIFQFIISETPKPTINAILPEEYDQEITPLLTSITNFQIQIANNGSPSLTNYDVHWQLFRTTGGSVAMGLLSPNDEDQDFSNTALTAVHTSQINFNPTVVGIGSYYLKARIIYFNGLSDAIIDERVWNVTVKHPDLGKVTGVTLPATGINVIAYNNLNYTQFPAFNWISPVSQAQFCVTVNDADGTYAADGDGVQVSWYLDGAAGDICTKETNDAGPSTQTICLTDANLCAGAVAFNPTVLTLLNSDPIIARNAPLTARVYDKFTSTQYGVTNIDVSPYLYPINWYINVRPINVAPTVAFTTTKPAGCVNGGTYIQNGCLATQGTNFTVGFTVTDDHYLPTTGNEGRFQWTVQLRHNVTDLNVAGQITACNKVFGAAVPAYASQWTCTLNVPHYSATGPLAPTDAFNSYAVIASVADQDSPVGGLSASSPVLTWNLVVAEANPVGSPVISAQVNNNLSSHVTSSSYVPDRVLTAIGGAGADVAELQTITFRPTIVENQRDNLDVRVTVCLTAACTGTGASLIPPGYINFLRSATADPTAASSSFGVHNYIIPEDLLLSLTPIQDIAPSLSAPVTFRIEVRDVPSVLTTPVRSDTEDFIIHVRNINPAPVINDTAALATPDTGTNTVVFAGFPFSIDPGTVSDALGPVSERTIIHQWYASRDAGVTWNIIPGANQRVLTWTPDNTSPASLILKLCVGDRALANPVNPANAYPQCSNTWTVTPKDYLQSLAAITLTGNDMLDEAAVWVDGSDPNVIYTAYVGNDKKIHIEKSVKDTLGNINLTSFRTISFDAIAAPASSNLITNLSIVGNADSLFIAYIASSTVAPTNMVPRVRRIDKQFTLAEQKFNLAHGGKFGFSYTALTGACSDLTDCTFATNGAAEAPAVINFLTTSGNATFVTINGATFTASSAPLAAEQFCNSTACATVNDSAVSLADAINKSIQAGVQGITAVASGANVNLFGMWPDDFLNFDGSAPTSIAINVLQNGMGKLMIDANGWYLPVIDASRTGAAQNNITLISGDLTTTNSLQNTSLSYSELNSGKAIALDAGLSAAGHLIIAKISGETVSSGEAEIQIYNFPLGSNDPSSAIDIFQTPAKRFQNIKLAPGATGNTDIFVMAKEQLGFGEEWNIGRYSSLLALEGESLMSDLIPLASPTDNTATIMTDMLVTNPEIISVPNFNEARIFFHSAASPRLARIRSDLTVTCGLCSSLTPGTLKATSKIGISNVSINATIGTAGSVLLENQKDVIYTLFNLETAGPSNRPQMGVINIEPEVIQSTTIDSANHLWRPAFVKD